MNQLIKYTLRILVFRFVAPLLAMLMYYRYTPLARCGRASQKFQTARVYLYHTLKFHLRGVFGFKCFENFVVIMLFFLPCFSCFAALNDAKTPKSDAKRAMYSAASAECQQTQKAESICLYSGNANFIQGDDKLRAQRIAVYRDTANQIYQIIAFGVQAGDRSYYDTLYALTNEDKGTASDKKPVHAEANVIKLFPLRNKALFIGAAKITRDQDLVTGSYVEYDIEKQTMLARPDLGKQTMMVLNPKQKQS